MPSWLTRAFFAEVGEAIDGWGWLSDEASAIAIDQAVGTTRNRPHPLSTLADYTSWDSLTDRTYLARHLPPQTWSALPAESEVQALFQRPPGAAGRTSPKSTCLFPAFAQYLTDGFIRTWPTDQRRTSTNHEIDLCPLYGRTPAQTRALRRCSETRGERGRLRSQMIGAEEFSPFLYPNGDNIADPAFVDLDTPLFIHAQPTPAPPPVWPREKLATIFAVGGDRVNSTPFAAMMNTLFLREHNRIAGALEVDNPAWDDERVFQTARNIVIVLFIKIVVEHYINHIAPLPFSLRAVPQAAWGAKWNRPNWITAEFSLLYRWHSLMPDRIQWPDGDIPIGEFTLDNRPLLRSGLCAAFAAAARQPSGQLGAFNTADALLPIEIFAVRQARANRLASYNSYRAAYSRQPATSFDQISSNPDVVALLARLYATPDDVEFYPGLFAEDLVADAPLPGLLMTMVAVDAFSQALTNPLLSEHVFNADTFTPMGWDLIHDTSKLGDLLARNQPPPGPEPIEMTQAGWHYISGP